MVRPTGGGHLLAEHPLTGATYTFATTPASGDIELMRARSWLRGIARRMGAIDG